MALHVYGVVSAATPLPGVLRGRREAPVRLDVDVRIRRDDRLHTPECSSPVSGARPYCQCRFSAIVETDEEVARNILQPRQGRPQLATLGEAQLRRGFRHGPDHVQSSTRSMDRSSWQ